MSSERWPSVRLSEAASSGSHDGSAFRNPQFVTPWLEMSTSEAQRGTGMAARAGAAAGPAKRVPSRPGMNRVQ